MDKKRFDIIFNNKRPVDDDPVLEHDHQEWRTAIENTWGASRQDELDQPEYQE